MKIGIVGSRTRTSEEDYKKVYNKFLDIVLECDKHYDYGEIQIISGGQKLGADGWAERIARESGCPITIYHSDWRALGKAAGPIRNNFIAKDSDVLIACLGEDSKGTKDTIEKFKKFHPANELFIV